MSHALAYSVTTKKIGQGWHLESFCAVAVAGTVAVVAGTVGAGTVVVVVWDDVQKLSDDVFQLPPLALGPVLWNFLRP